MKVGDTGYISRCGVWGELTREVKCRIVAIHKDKLMIEFEDGKRDLIESYRFTPCFFVGER